MKIFKNTNFSILFGNLQTSPFTGGEFHSLIEQNREILQSKIQAKTHLIQESFPINNLLFLRQVHGISGEIISTATIPIPLWKDGDYLITNTKNLGIGVLTADCLPIVFYDHINNIAAIAHAGWPGSVAGIATKIINEMQSNFNSKINDIKIFFGPCAKICCYEVQHDFLDKLEYKKQTQASSRRPEAQPVPSSVEGADTSLFASGIALATTEASPGRAIFFKNNKIFFNLPLYNVLILEKIGVDKKNIDLNYNFCTICNIEYCSYRRDKEKSGRQMTIITLN